MEDQRRSRLVNEVFIITNPRLPDNPVIYVDNHFAEYTGYTVDDFVGKNCRFLQKELVSEEAKRLAKEVVTFKEERVFEVLNLKKNGNKFINRFKMVPHHNCSGQLCFLVGKHLEFISLDIEIIKTQSISQQKVNVLNLF